MNPNDRLIEGEPLGLADGTRAGFGFGSGVAPGRARFDEINGSKTAFDGKRTDEAAACRVNNLQVESYHAGASRLALGLGAVTVTDKRSGIRNHCETDIVTGTRALAGRVSHFTEFCHRALDNERPLL